MCSDARSWPRQAWCGSTAAERRKCLAPFCSVQRSSRSPTTPARSCSRLSALRRSSGLVEGVPSPASGLRLRPRDLAKFGSLYLHDGRWNGRQVLPREWVHESTRRRLTFPGQQARGYAYQWWHACYATPSGVIEVPTAVGNGMQRIFLLRAQRTVVTVLSGRYNDLSSNPPERLLLEFIIPALPPPSTSPCPS